ncbi:MAG TPA: hypothetical protein DCL41_11015, partial [Bdellovibrionales bacterium]|nr:hypothetical protein [Bdellovibrionales bacterium]
MNHIQILHEQALEAAKNYRKFESQLLVLLQNLDQHKVHYKMGYRSLFHYFTEALKLSESVSYMLINVSRKAKEVPELKHEI